MPQRLTATLIHKLKPKETRYSISDEKTKGLCLVVYPTGNKRFYYRKRVAGQKKILREPIGDASVISLDDARDAAQVIAGNIVKGLDLRPKCDQSNESDSNTNLELFSYIDNYYKPYAKKESVTADAAVRTLKREFDFLSNKPINIINGDDIDKWRSKKSSTVVFSTIQRAYSILKACINSAVYHYKLIDNFELQKYRLKRKKDERVNPPKIRYLSEEEEIRLRRALKARDDNLKAERKRYVKWQSQRKKLTKKRKEPYNESDFPDHITPIVILAYQTGFDLGDIFDFNWQDHIDLDNHQIRKIRNKTKYKQDSPKPVVVSLSCQAEEVLRQWGKQHGMVGRVFKSP